MNTLNLLENFAKMIDSPNGSAFIRVEEKHNEKTWLKSGRISKWISYDVDIFYVKDNELRKIYWCLIGGRIKTSQLLLSTNKKDLQYLAEFKPANKLDVLNALNKSFYDSRESRYTDEEVKQMEIDFIEDQLVNLSFIND